MLLRHQLVQMLKNEGITSDIKVTRPRSPSQPAQCWLAEGTSPEGPATCTPNGLPHLPHLLSTWVRSCPTPCLTLPILAPFCRQIVRAATAAAGTPMQRWLPRCGGRPSAPSWQATPPLPHA